ncbi:MAG: hypothetical protein WAV09_02955 [Minisyncoccia bacterium]
MKGLFRRARRGNHQPPFKDTYHVDEFQEYGLCGSGPGKDSAIVGPWSEVEKHGHRVNCSQCLLLIAVMRANKLEYLFTTQMEVLVETINRLLCERT